MFRFLFRSLMAPRPSTQARRQVQHFRPRLEALEDRLAPSGFAHAPIQGYEGGGNANITTGGYVHLRVEPGPNGSIVLII